MPIDRGLRARKVFTVACAHVFADGRVDVRENEVLRRLTVVLGLDKLEALELAAAARRACRSTGFRPPGALDPRRLFHELCVVARADGTLDPEERELLAGVAEVLGVLEAPGEEPRPAPVRAVAVRSATASPASDLAGCADEEGRAWESGATPAGWLARLARRVRHPIFTVTRLLDPDSAFRRVRASGRRIRKLARRAPSGGMLSSVVERVSIAVETVWELERQLDELTRYLDERGLSRPAARPRAGPLTAVEEMHARRQRLAAALTRMVAELERIEDRVASFVLARSAVGLPGQLEHDLREAMEELEVVVSVLR